ncbi:MAG: hypothetical protein M5U23_11580 [Acidimicrobiia bacterium]|nr:hypothetical protein [Acidimicrobiia bacterium]
MSALISEVESLYRGVVTEPDTWSSQAVSDWIEGAATSEEVDKTAAKYLRRVVKMAEKLRAFWSVDARVTDAAITWQSRVDLAFGPRAWRPVLDLADHLFELQPTEELFETVAELFRVVNNRPWLDGVSYDQWRSQSHAK